MYPFSSPAICNCSYSTYNCLTMLYDRKGLLKASKSTVDWPGILAIVYDSWTDVLAMRIFGRSQPVFNFCSLSFHVFENVFENKGQCWSLEMGLDAWLIDLWPLYLRRELFRKFPEILKMAYLKKVLEVHPRHRHGLGRPKNVIWMFLFSLINCNCVLGRFNISGNFRQFTEILGWSGNFKIFIYTIQM